MHNNCLLAAIRSATTSIPDDLKETIGVKQHVAINLNNPLTQTHIPFIKTSLQPSALLTRINNTTTGFISNICGRERHIIRGSTAANCIATTSRTVFVSSALALAAKALRHDSRENFCFVKATTSSATAYIYQQPNSLLQAQNWRQIKSSKAICYSSLGVNLINFYI